MRLLLLLLILTQGAFAQTKADLFENSSTPIFWLGIDYSHIKLIGPFSQFVEAGEVGPSLIKNKYFDSWNDIIMFEYKKYNIGEAFRNDNIQIKTSAISKINATTAVNSLESEEEPNYTRANIEKFIKNYDLGKKEGIGLLLVAESYNKIKESARYHFVAINLENNKVILYDYFITKPGGLGLRNYWARSIYNVINEIRNRRYREWQSE